MTKKQPALTVGEPASRISQQILLISTVLLILSGVINGYAFLEVGLGGNWFSMVAVTVLSLGGLVTTAFGFTDRTSKKQALQLSLLAGGHLVVILLYLTIMVFL